MLLEEKIIQEDEKSITKRVTYERLGTVEKFGNVDALVREICYIFRHTQYPIVKMVIEQGKNITYTQAVIERKANQEGLDEKVKAETDLPRVDKL